MIVQHITTGWTKAARGGDPAAARGRVPDRLPVGVPKARRASPPPALLHEVTFGEADGFAVPASDVVMPLRTAACVRAAAVEATRSGDAVRATVTWREGRPRRGRITPAGHAEPVVKTFDVPPGRWVRVLYNARFSCGDTGTWWYERHAVNVAALPPHHPAAGTLFTATPPAAEWVSLEWLR